MAGPRELLDAVLASAVKLGKTPAISDKDILQRTDYVCRCLTNRAGVRLLMSCMLAKLDRPEVDPRKPYTEIGSKDCFSGRMYDEQYLTGFITMHRLPCNNTTAFLTPALRNQTTTLKVGMNLSGRPPEVYQNTLQLLDDVAKGRVTAEQVLTDTLRILVLVRDEKQERMKTQLEALQQGAGALPLATEQIVSLLRQHLACKNSSRLPVLMVAAAYQAAAGQLGEKAVQLRGHLAADEQTGAGGDVEICLVNDERVCTIYEMKSKRVTMDDIDRAIQKIVIRKPRIDNYIFITTDLIGEDVAEYADSMYEQTSGTEIAILDCVGFVRHFLHLFHRRRIQFLDVYQDLLLNEPDSAVNQPLKEAFLSLRLAAESDE
ncbi:MAG: restriction endonuclease, SacI family [Planctomycetes bacterium]|nr:restriction endonuclease, SacI family [Planctomycetota bacterium]